MTNIEKIERIQSLIDSNSSSLKLYYDLFEEMEDIVYNYTDYLEQNVDKEFERLPEADYHMCCCLLTLILREDHFINGKFEERFKEGKVISILSRMIKVLK